jgi:hypothetical protein
MDLLTTILTCSLYASDDSLVRAIAEGPSGSDPYLVLDPAADAAQASAPAPARSETEATARARGLTAKGGRPLLGLLELPPSWLDLFGRPLAGAFDPCTNIAIGSAMLSEFDFECAGSSPKVRRPQGLERVNRRTCVLHKYEAALGVDDFAIVIELELSAQPSLTPPVQDAPIFPPMTAPHWGSDQLLVLMPLSTTPATVRASREP